MTAFEYISLFSYCYLLSIFDCIEKQQRMGQLRLFSEARRGIILTISLSLVRSSSPFYGWVWAKGGGGADFGCLRVKVVYIQTGSDDVGAVQCLNPNAYLKNLIN